MKILFAISTWLLSCMALAGGTPEDIADLRSLLLPLESLSADFQQEVRDSEGFSLQTSEGEFSVAQPGKLRWIVKAPMEQQVISDGDTLWIYDPDLEQVTVQPANQDLAATPAALFSGDLEELDATWFVRQQIEGATRTFSLTPEQEGNLFSEVILVFENANPVQMTLRDSLGQTTAMQFSRLQINPSLDDSQFQLTIPEGVDVIHNANPTGND